MFSSLSLHECESTEANTSLTPFPAPHYPQCFTRYQLLLLPSLTQRKSKKKEGSHPSPWPTKYHQWKQSLSGQQPAPSISWGSCPVPAQVFQTIRDVLRDTLYFTFSCDLLVWDLTGQIPLTFWDLPKTFTWGCTDAGPQHRRNTCKSTELIYCCWTR